MVLCGTVVNDVLIIVLCFGIKFECFLFENEKKIITLA